MVTCSPAAGSSSSRTLSNTSFANVMVAAVDTPKHIAENPTNSRVPGRNPTAQIDTGKEISMPIIAMTADLSRAASSERSTFTSFTTCGSFSSMRTAISTGLVYRQVLAIMVRQPPMKKTKAPWPFDVNRIKTMDEYQLQTLDEVTFQFTRLRRNLLLGVLCLMRDKGVAEEKASFKRSLKALGVNPKRFPIWRHINTLEAKSLPTLDELFFLLSLMEQRLAVHCDAEVDDQRHGDMLLDGQLGGRVSALQVIAGGGLGGVQAAVSDLSSDLPADARVRPAARKSRGSRTQPAKGPSKPRTARASRARKPSPRA